MALSQHTPFKVGDRIMVAAITPDWSSLEAQGGYPMHSNGMLAGWKFSNFKDGVFGRLNLPSGVDIEIKL